jgi:hypothetical protein
MAELIRIEGLDVDDAGRLIVALSAVPSNEWQEFFIQLWRNTPQWSSGFRRSVFAGFEGDSIVLRNVSVEDFVSNHKAVIETALRQANEQASMVETAAADEAREAREEEARHKEVLEAERQRAREVKFD